jgi:IPT/TIG domain-containing protein
LTVLRPAGVKGLVPIAAVLAVAIATVGAFAYYTSSGTGTASASVGTLNPPTGVAVSPSGSTVTVSWAAPSGGVAPQGYYVQRYLGSTPSPACGTSPGTLTTPSSAITCPDTGVAAGTYTYTVTAVYNSWTATSSASAPATVAGLATKLVFTTTAQTLTAGVTSGSIIVQREDASGNPTTSGALTLNLGTTSSGAMFRDTGDSTTITTVTIADTSSSASFKYKDTASGAPTITASVTGGTLTSATQTETVNAAAAGRLVFATTAQTLTAGVNSGTITVQRQDSFNNPTSLGGALTVNLATSSAGGIFRDTGNTTTITSVQIASSANSASFLYKDTVSGSPTITASVTGGTPTSATQTETVKAAAASKLAFLTGPQTFLAGNAPSGGSGAISVQVQDSFGNPVFVTSNLPLTAASVPSGGVAFVTTQGGTTACGASGCFVPAGSSLGSFYMTDASASSDNVTVTAGALTTPSQTYTVNAAAGSETVTVTYLSGALTPNGTASYTVTVTNNTGARSFQLAGVSGLPAGAVAAVLPSSCATNIAFHGTTSFPLSITSSGGATPVGTFSFVVLVNASTSTTSCTTVNENTQGSGVLNVTAAPATVSGLTPTSGPVGRTGVTINASGFITSHALTVTVGGTSAPITSGGTSDVNGNSTVTFTIPSLSVGSKAVVVSDGTNSATSGTNFTVTTPVLSGLSPTSGAVGTTGVTINASGFINSHALTVTVGGASAAISSGGTTDATGSSTLTFTIPSLSAGSKAVVVSDGTNSATSGTNFTVTTPAVSGLSPTTGPVGTTGVTINASGFIASHSLTVTVGGASAAIASGGTTNAGGGSTVTFTIPALTAGSKTVTVSDGTNSINSATNFTVAPLITLAASSGSVGDTVTITGTGFAGSSTISTRTYDGAALTLAPTTPATSSSGGFSATFTVPASVAGVHTVLLKDASNNQATATFTVAPQITLTPSTGNPGSTDSISGTGFAATSAISATFNSSAVALGGTTTTGATGSFSAATYTVPSLTAAPYALAVTDASSNSGSATFTISAVQTITFVQQAVEGSGPANGETPTLTSPPANGHTLILLVGDDGSGSATVSGTPSGGGVTTWNRVTSVLGSGTPNAGEVEVWYGLVTCSPCNSGDEAVTVTMSHSTNIQFVNVSEWSGIATSNPVDGTVANSATGTATSSAFTISTNGVLSQANELIITDGWVESAAFGFSTPQNASPGYTALSQTMAGGIVFRAFGAYQIDPTTTQISATWPENGSGSGAFYATAIAAFKHQ